MNREKAIIQMISEILPRSASQMNRPFEADAEILRFDGQRLLVNIDEFSGEDLFRETDGFQLGWNMALGGLSDILATGGQPLYYGHSMTLRPTWTWDYIRAFAQGVAAVLEAAHVDFIGGDLGFSESWRYTVTVLGRLDGKPLLRSAAEPGDKIYLTGKVGAGNLEACLNRFSEQLARRGVVQPLKNRFCLRVNEAALLRDYAQACIDTSDGVLNALNDLAEASGVGFEIENVPYLDWGLRLAKMVSLPEELLFLGECGEYELLFTIKEAVEMEFIAQAQQAGFHFYDIGRIVAPQTRQWMNGERRIDLSSFRYRARDYEHWQQYLQEVIAYIKQVGQ